MKLKINPLTSDLTPDYLDFFDNRAFSDNNPCGPCYCTSPNTDATAEQQMVGKQSKDSAMETEIEQFIDECVIYWAKAERRC